MLVRLFYSVVGVMVTATNITTAAVGAGSSSGTGSVSVSGNVSTSVVVH
jgi:hypothetical protein